MTHPAFYRTVGAQMLHGTCTHGCTCRAWGAGDADQLAPVGPGTILEAAMKAGVVPIIDLREVFRQAAESAIVTSAHALLRGEMPALTRDPHYPQVCDHPCTRDLVSILHAGTPASLSGSCG